ncbi:MAG: hypothetical protein IM673_14680 [Phenylobacterium sp.]|nr:hypothetical protein [Phenylobacterium sp.]MCA3736077.1 hypothetical protein [Phenylobacterium sp.]MCA3739282.1 hypothetical protein [Phenylobacterium sp.]MCA3754701.1 hypothetical protein [Phenylobacterium sp.]MCA4915878.1 hypothetical protein [Phenylobacterium sp.]MCA6236172.1 hypothetical protein [Phenylobacterium sp.]
MHKTKVLPPASIALLWASAVAGALPRNTFEERRAVPLPSEILSSQSGEEEAEVLKRHPAGKWLLAAVATPTHGVVMRYKQVELQHKEARVAMPDWLQLGEALVEVVARPNPDKTDRGLLAGTVVLDARSHSPANRSYMALAGAEETIPQRAAPVLDEAEMVRVMVPSPATVATH